MKQPKVQIPDPAPPVFVSKGPRYRYFVEPPSVVTLRVGDLLSDVPDAVRVLGCDADFAIEFAAAEILQGAAPKVSLSRLVELAPDCFRTAGMPDLQIRLPASRLALSYRMVTGRELIEEEVFIPPPEEEVKIEGDTEGEINAVEEKAVVEPETPMEEKKPEPPPIAEIPLPPVDIPPLESISLAPEPPVETPPPADLPEPIKEAVAAPLPEPPPAADTASLDAAPLSPPPPPLFKADPGPKPPPPTPPQARSGIFSMLPIFRRKAAAPALPPEKPPRQRVELPPPRVASHHPFEVINVIDPPANPVPIEKAGDVQKVDEAAQPEIVQSAMPEVAPPPAMPKEEAIKPQPPVIAPPLAEPMVSTALLVETEHLPRERPRQVEGEIPDHDGLQALFHTEDFLTVDRVVELCGGLPGINSCVLSHGAAVIASHNVPDSIDLVSLSAHALEMLRAMRESSAKMGIGAVPAVTIHSEKGPITFFHQEDLCLLVLHKDKGFVPGVREKLQNVVGELAKARLQRPLASTPQRTIED